MSAGIPLDVLVEAESALSLSRTLLDGETKPTTEMMVRISIANARFAGHLEVLLKRQQIPVDTGK